MNKSRDMRTLGGSSLLVIFGVLCLTVFALLSLNTVLAEQRLTQASMEAAAVYYGADLEAERIYAALRAGQMPDQVTREGELYSYSCPISQYQTLYVVLRCRDQSWQVVTWQAVSELEITEETIPLL